MKIKFLLPFLLLAFCGFSQFKKEIDSINKLDYTFISNNLETCKSLFEKNIRDSKRINYEVGQANSLNNLGLVYALLGVYDLSVANYIKSVKIFEKQKNFEKVARIYSDIGFRIRYVDEKKGFYYFRLAIKIGEQNNIGKELAPIYNNYGELFLEREVDSALYYYKKSLKIAQEKNVVISIPFSLNKIAVAYAKKKLFKLAFSYLDKSDEIRYKTKDDWGIADNLAYRGDIFYEIPVIDSAIFYYEKSIILARKTKYNSLERFCLERLADLYERKGAFGNALFHFKKFKELEDSALNKNVKNELANFEVKYGTEKTKRELAEKNLKLEANKKWITLSLSAVFFVLLILFFVYRYQKTKRKNILKQAKLNEELEKSRLEKDFLDEKLRIGRELHDNIGSHLTFMISSLDNLEYVENPQTRIDKIADLSNFGRLTMKDLRDTIWAMNHDEGSFELLITRISELRAVLPNSLFVDIKSDIQATKSLNGLQLLNCYRIVQEFIQNTIKYAEASEIKINLTDKNDSFELSLSDNGKGFDLKEISFGNGILNMKRRCEDLKGKFSVESSEKGTSVTCLIPF